MVVLWPLLELIFIPEFVNLTDYIFNLEFPVRHFLEMKLGSVCLSDLVILICVFGVVRQDNVVDQIKAGWIGKNEV